MTENDRAVRRAAAWYKSHLAAVAKKCAPAIVILTNDQQNKAKSKQDTLNALTLQEYVSDLDDADRLLDMIAEGPGTRQLSGELFYPDYYTESKVKTGLKTSTLHQGVFHVSTFNYLEGTVKGPSLRTSRY